MTGAAASRQDGRLAAEWERAEILARSLERERRGRPVGDGTLTRLKTLQAKVAALRRRGPDSPWAPLVTWSWAPLLYDIMALVLAPEVVPRLGWHYQALQPGVNAPYPSSALLRELLALDETETADWFTQLDPAGPLRQHRLLQVVDGDPYQPVTPGPGVVARLMGWPSQAAPPPGALRVPVAGDWDDLVLPADRLDQLHEFLFWIERRRQVESAWGGRAVGGPVGLFTGPSGTGKTFAAAVIAGVLGWPLYRVDLGTLVSKYIGETEKNLNRLFDAAHDQSMVLQFDEADSLFAKRGEIKEARDRYANMEVSHLLARIEVHRGPVILTTNLRHQLDPAFARRFQVVVDFPRPDAAARTELWRRALPPRAPLGADLDTEFLGRSLPLTGGAIHNAALYAAYLAAGREQSLGLSQVAVGVWRELSKDGRKVSPADLGALAPWLNGGAPCH